MCSGQSIYSSYLWCLENVAWNMKTLKWLWISNCVCVFFKHRTNRETDAGAKFTWAIKQSPWRPAFKHVCVCAHVPKAHTCDVAQKLVRYCLSLSLWVSEWVSECKDEHASIWRAKSSMSVSGQLVQCDDGGTLVRWKTGEVLVMVTQAEKWELEAENVSLWTQTAQWMLLRGVLSVLCNHRACDRAWQMSRLWVWSPWIVSKSQKRPGAPYSLLCCSRKSLIDDFTEFRSIV